MPFVIPAVAAAAAAAGAAGISGATLGAALAIGGLAFGANLVLGALSTALAKKPKAPQLGQFSLDAGRRTTTVRQAVTVRDTVYGEVRKGGALVYVETTTVDGAANGHLHLVIALAGHEVEAIGDVWFDDYVVRPDMLDGNGDVTEGRYLFKSIPHARIKKHLGTASQTADADLVAASSGWTAAHRLRGVAYIYVRLRWQPDLFAAGIPNVTAVVRGKKLYDDRTATTVWSPNPALCIRDYLTDTALGLRAATAKINESSFSAAANTCEEQVAVVEASDDFTADAASDELTRSTGNARWQRGDVAQVATTGTLPAGLSAGTDYYVIPVHETVFKLASSYANALAGTAIDITDAGSGTHTATRKSEPRYTCNGVVSSDEAPIDIIQALNTALMGKVVMVGGAWKLYAGAYITPTVTLDEDDLRGPVSIKTLVSRRESLNAVKGVFVSPDNNWQPSDFPPVKNATYLSEDGGERIWKDIELPYTISTSMAERIAKIELERARQEITVEMPCKLTAYEVEPPEVVNIDNDRMGWSGKPFEVVSARLAPYEADGAPALGVDLTLRETASAVYDWNSGEETTVDPAPDTNLPNPFSVDAPTGLDVQTEIMLGADNSEVLRFKLTWTSPGDANVSPLGRFEVQFKREAAATWEPSFRVGGAEGQAFIGPVHHAVDYDIRVRAVNVLGATSDWVTLTGITAEPSGADEDWGLFQDTVSGSEDWGNFVDSPTSAENWGNFTI